VSTGPVRLALLGLGSMGLHHLKIFHSLAPWAQITAVADSHPPFAERAAAIIPTAKAFHDPLDCLQNADLDAVVVATSDDTHPAIVEACIARGIYVLCEKPLTLSADESLRLVMAERASGRRLIHVAFMRRYDPDYRRIFGALRSGRVGEPILIRQRHHNPLAANTFDAEMLLTSSAAHEIDLFRWLTGAEINAVDCLAKRSDDGLTVIVLVTLRSQTGVLGVVEVGRGPAMRYDVGLDLVASGGCETLGATPRLGDTWLERFDDAYRTQDAAWLTSAANHAIAGPSTYDGYAANAVAAAALAALTSGGTKVVRQIPADDIIGQPKPDLRER
jgi:myo-inositol 2-dehydrogenase / D-chiro-inositol 1-dehydrogenase